jgi:ABC-type transport system involved in multi-copper enzyme maturation permease subunit
MRHLLAAERVRFGRRRDLWILVLLVPVIMGVLFVMEFNALTTPPGTDFVMDPPDPVLEAEYEAQALAEWRQRLTTQLSAFAYPASLLKVAGNVVPLVLLAIYVSVALAAGEFEWGTVRTLHLTSPRGRLFAVRLLVIVGLVAVAWLLAMALGAIMPFFMHFESTPLQDFAITTPDLVGGVLLRLAAVLPFAAIPALLSVLTRSLSLAFLLTALFIALDLAIVAMPFWTTSPITWLPVLTVSGSIIRLVGSPEAPIAAAPGPLAVAALLAWGVVPLVLAVARFRHIDLNE